MVSGCLLLVHAIYGMASSAWGLGYGGYGDRRFCCSVGFMFTNLCSKIWQPFDEKCRTALTALFACPEVSHSIQTNLLVEFVMSSDFVMCKHCMDVSNILCACVEGAVVNFLGQSFLLIFYVSLFESDSPLPPPPSPKTWWW